jgi:hypothetical protein
MRAFLPERILRHSMPDSATAGASASILVGNGC